MVALEKDRSKERMLGWCGILRKPGVERGEFAVVVRDAWPGIGVGAKLVEASLPDAWSKGMKAL
jgi:N-acetylglutamate synthase-like GNAT family acetyltransferase